MARVILGVEYEYGDPFIVEVGQFQTILQIKEIIHAQQGIPVAKQILKFHGDIFSDECLFSYTECFDEERIELGLALAEGETLILDPPGKVERHLVPSAISGQPPVPYYGPSTTTAPRSDQDLDDIVEAIFSSLSPEEIDELKSSDTLHQPPPPPTPVDPVVDQHTVHVDVEMEMIIGKSQNPRVMVNMKYKRPGSRAISKLEINGRHTVWTARTHLAAELRIRRDQLTLLVDGNKPDDELTLLQSGISHHSALTLTFPTR